MIAWRSIVRLVLDRLEFVGNGCMRAHERPAIARRLLLPGVAPIGSSSDRRCGDGEVALHSGSSGLAASYTHRSRR